MSINSIYDGAKQEAAISTESLETRLRINQAYASNDFGSWLFERLEVKSGEDILDVGCGNGAQTIPFLEKVRPNGSVCALDLSKSSIEELKEKAPTGAPLFAVASDMLQLGTLIEEVFPIKQYDLTHSSYALYYSSNREAVLDHMRESLKPGGRCAIFTPNAPHELVEFAARFHPIDKALWECFRFGPEVLKPYFDANYGSVAVHHFNNRVRLPDAETLMSFYEATTYYDAKAAPALRAEAERIVAETGAFEYEKNGYLIIGREPR